RCKFCGRRGLGFAGDRRALPRMVPLQLRLASNEPGVVGVQPRVRARPTRSRHLRSPVRADLLAAPQDDWRRRLHPCLPVRDDDSVRDHRRRACAMRSTARVLVLSVVLAGCHGPRLEEMDFDAETSTIDRLAWSAQPDDVAKLVELATRGETREARCRAMSTIYGMHPVPEN